MIEWYDILLAIVFAWVLLNLAFIPFIGVIWAYLLYDYGWSYYCNFRRNQYD